LIRKTIYSLFSRKLCGLYYVFYIFGSLIFRATLGKKSLQSWLISNSGKQVKV